MKSLKLFAVVAGLLLPVLPVEIKAQRVCELIDSGWHFHLGDVPEAKTIGFDDSAWRTLDVPHDWSIEGDYSKTNATADRAGWLPGGIGWYRRVIEMTESWQGKNVLVEFEGVYMNSEVWLNGERVGGRPYGYMTFNCDLTAHLKPGKNILAVRVDNTLDPSSRWYHGCGIYGHVRVIVTDPVSIPAGGVFVKTPEVSADSATISACVEVKNHSRDKAAVEVQLEVLSPGGQSLAALSVQTEVAPEATQIQQPSIKISKPVLWSVETPSLYTLKTRILRDEKIIDEVTTPFGIRSLRFDANEGFFLNGKAVKIKGVCEHQGASPVGAALPAALLERRIQQLKDMGCNSIRTAHNPHLPEFYDVCDRMGILVMDEIFDGWHRKAPQDYGGRFFAEWWQRDATDWVRRDRNHPCVIFWSIGNETGLHDSNNITALIHQLDDTRPTTGGAVITGVDVAGFNGGIVPKDNIIEDFHREHPQTPIVMTEEPHTFQTRGFYRTKSAIFRSMDPLPDYADPEVFSGGHSAYRSSYDNCGRRLVARNCWRRTLDRPWVMGEYRWTGFDYIGESAWSGNESLAREFNFGVLDLAGFPKDEYYFHQSVWTEKPMVHLLPHWTHPGLEGKSIPVVAYANADDVELFQDGKSLGRKPRSTLFECVWQVPYQPGELKAIAYRGGKVVAETVQRTAGAPAKLELTTDNISLKPSRADLALVSLAVHDANGTLVPDADQMVALATTGPVHWLGGENGDPVDLTPQRETSRKVFNGLSRGFYAGIEDQAAPVEIMALAILGTPYFSAKAEVGIACERISLRGALQNTTPTVRYTIDGAEPTVDSPVYTKPLLLGNTTVIKAAAFRDGKSLAMVSGTFTKGVKPQKVNEVKSRGELGAAEDPINTKQPGNKKPKKKQ